MRRMSTRRRQPRLPNTDEIHAYIEEMATGELHAKRVLSLANATEGLLRGASLAVHAIGQGLAQAQELNPKHAVKQVDRLLSNAALPVEDLQSLYVRHVLRGENDIVVALDWTDFDADDHATLMLSLVPLGRHGRALPLRWRTYVKSVLGGARSTLEADLLTRFEAALDAPIRVTVLADRGFGDTALYEHLRSLEFDFVIRFRGAIIVESAEGESKPASEWVPKIARAKKLAGARVTRERVEVPAVVCVRDRGMKDAWCLATSRGELSAQEIVKLYSRRFTIEEQFRDTKDLRFGFGLSATRIGRADRRDRLLFVAAIAYSLLVLLGMAAEEIGYDRMLKVNTVKTRTHSLVRQGLYWFGALPNMSDERLRPLMEAFYRLLRGHDVFTRAFGLE
jgi:hypothetical protein